MKTKTILLIASLSGSITSAILYRLFPVGTGWVGWLSGAILMALAIYFLLVTVNAVQAGKQGLVLTLSAFAIRLVVGIGLMVALPVWGYDNDQQNAGYVFNDAYSRDTAAYELAASGDSLLTVFNAEFFTDQYGGLAFLSALVYRIFSMDAHRPYLMLIVTSFAFALGVPFFYTAVKKRLDARLALAASWIITLYPEGIFFTASQMREPFMIGGLMVLIWGVITWFEKDQRKHVLLLCIPAVLVLAAFSWLMTGAILLVLAGWFGIEWIQRHLPAAKHKRAYLILITAIVLVLTTAAFLGRQWLRETIWWDMTTMLHSSGHLEVLIEEQPRIIQYGFITTYGVLQILPPAALIESSALLWKLIAVLRSLGWYLFLPLLIFGIYANWKKENKTERPLMSWLLAFTWFWIVFASLRGGGDAWDNPRYRMLALPVIAMLVVWFWRQRDGWLWRLAAIMGVAIALFTHWYISRYWQWWPPLSIINMILAIGIVAVFIIGSGFWWERKRRKST
ncbi:MAG: hypothetical protein V2J07_02800 [Anaerolineae bacterium]|jgi:hypothetical protein|nr:hypothetical protein [Anaerolineae bacterium]